MKDWLRDYLTDANGDADGVALWAGFAFVALTAFAIHEVYFVMPHQPFNYMGYGTAIGIIFTGLGAKAKLEKIQ